MDDIQRGEIWWADLPGPRRMSELTGFSRDSVVNVFQVLTLDRSFLTEQGSVDAGLRLVQQP
jgi:mRNA-degrading endonuclease toxin of MazEF toxin-antitoxin module